MRQNTCVLPLKLCNSSQLFSTVYYYPVGVFEWKVILFNRKAPRYTEWEKVNAKMKLCTSVTWNQSRDIIMYIMQMCITINKVGITYRTCKKFTQWWLLISAWCLEHLMVQKFVSGGKTFFKNSPRSNKERRITKKSMFIENNTSKNEIFPYGEDGRGFIIQVLLIC